MSKSVIQGGCEYPMDALKLVTLYCERPKTTEILISTGKVVCCPGSPVWMKSVGGKIISSATR